MTMDEVIRKFALVLVDYSLGVREGDKLLISSVPAAEPLVLAVFEAALRRGAHPEIDIHLPEAQEIFFKHATDEQLAYISPRRRAVFEEYDAYLQILAPTNTRSLSGADPAKLSRSSAAMQPLMEKMLRRASEGEFRWTLTLFPTPALAQEAEMSTSEFREFVWRACKLTYPDPISEWRKLAELQRRYVDWLDGRSRFEVRGSHIDITFSTEGRRWISCDGRENFPDGEIFTSPVEDSVDGWVEFTYPAVYNGRLVDGVRLEFEGGRLKSATARSGEKFLQEMLQVDEGARRVGEIAFATNYDITRFSKNTLFDEKIGGTLHIALGNSYPEAGGKNRSAIHWDMVCDMSDAVAKADGEKFYENGRFLI